MDAQPGISKYFIALIPPSPGYEQTQQWKEFFRTEFNLKAALNSPPHITLHMPFEWKTGKENVLIEKLSAFTSLQNSFELNLKNFGCFPPRVIYIQVMESMELKTLQSSLTRFCKTELNLFNANRLDKPYHPHLTVAFRDLKKAMFPKAWEAVKNLNFELQFDCRHLVLLKHGGGVWRAERVLELGS